MTGFGDRMRIQKEVVELFNETHPDRHPISQSMVSNIESKYRKFGHVTEIMKKAKYHPYKVCLVHELSEDDRRNQFCEQMQELCNNDNNFIKNVIFSDEVTFVLNGHVNRQNCRYWATENPRWMTEYHTQSPQKVNVWCGIADGRILGPYFFDVNQTGARFLDFLRDDIIPELITIYPTIEGYDLPRNDIFFQ